MSFSLSICFPFHSITHVLIFTMVRDAQQLLFFGCCLLLLGGMLHDHNGNSHNRHLFTDAGPLDLTWARADKLPIDVNLPWLPCKCTGYEYDYYNYSPMRVAYDGMRRSKQATRCLLKYMKLFKFAFIITINVFKHDFTTIRCM